MLWRSLRDIGEGFFIDVGAHHPKEGSVTHAFYERGWRGINIEPIAEPYASLQRERPRDINLNLCAGNKNGEIIIYDVSPSGLATAVPSIAEEYKESGYSVKPRHVLIKRLSDICSEHVDSDIHFLKIDVEGFEKEVLEGMDFIQWRPWIIVVEATYPNSPKESFKSWENLLLGSDYIFAYSDGLNRFYVSTEHHSLVSNFKTPPNFFDGFALSSTCFFARHVKQELNQVREEFNKAQSLATRMQKHLKRENEHSQMLETDLRKLNGRIEKLENELNDANRQIEDFKISLHESSKCIRSKEAEIRYWELKCHDKDRAISDIYSSASWRLSSPLRHSKMYFTYSVRGIVKAAKRVIKPAINVALSKVSEHHNLARPINEYLKRYPKLHGHIRVYALNQGITINNKADESGANNFDSSENIMGFNVESGRTKEIYLELKRPSKDNRGHG